MNIWDLRTHLAAATDVGDDVQHAAVEVGDNHAVETRVDADTIRTIPANETNTTWAHQNRKREGEGGREKEGPANPSVSRRWLDNSAPAEYQGACTRRAGLRLGPR